MVSCGGDHTIILTEEGKAFSFGLSTNGQLGLGTRLLEAPKPVLISALSTFKLIQVKILTILTIFGYAPVKFEPTYDTYK